MLTRLRCLLVMHVKFRPPFRALFMADIGLNRDRQGRQRTNMSTGEPSVRAS